MPQVDPCARLSVPVQPPKGRREIGISPISQMDSTAIEDMQLYRVGGQFWVNFPEYLHGCMILLLCSLRSLRLNNLNIDSPRFANNVHNPACPVHFVF